MCKNPEFRILLSISIYMHTGLIAAPEFAANAEVIPTIMRTNANGLATSEIMRLAS